MALSRRLKLRLVLSALFLAAFLAVTFSVVSNGYAFSIDRNINEIITFQEGSFAFSFFNGLTNLASTTVVVILSALLLAFFVYKKKYGFVFLIVFVLGGGALFEVLLKSIVHRARPIGALIAEPGYSFPSGHALKAVLFFSLLVYLFLQNFRRDFNKIVFIFVCAVLTLLIGFSRIYLHVHWASDVLAGWLFGFAWFFFSVFLLERIWK